MHKINLLVLAALLCLALHVTISLLPVVFVEAAMPIPGAWGTPVFYPGEKYSHAMSCVNNTDGTVSLLISGGLTATHDTSQTIHEYNLDTGRFYQYFDDGLAPRSEHALFHSQKGGQTLVVGGADATGFPASQAVFSNGVGMGRFLPISLDGAPSVPIHSFGSWQAVNDPDKFYLMGGLTSQGATNQLVVIDTTLGKFKERYYAIQFGLAATRPTSRFGVCCSSHVVFDGSGNSDGALCFGGSTLTGESNELWFFNETSAKWFLVSTTGTAPGPRSWSACAFLNKTHFAVFGGQSSTSKSVPDSAFYVFDSVARKWHSIPQVATSLLSQGATGAKMIRCTASNGTSRVIMYGGKVNPTLLLDEWLVLRDPSSTSYPNSPNTALQFDAWQVAAENPSWVPRLHHNLEMVAGLLYVLNGITSSGLALNDVWSYSPKTKIWNAVNINGSKWSARFGAASCTTFGTTIFLFGGFSQAGTPMQDLWMLDVVKAIATNSWVVASTSPSPRGFAFATFIENQIFLFSGTQQFERGAALADAWNYQLEKQVWTQLSQVMADGTTNNLPPARYGAVSAALNETAIVFGLGQDQAEVITDFYYVTSVNATHVVYSPILASANENLQRKYGRAFASGGVVGDRDFFVCGGKGSACQPVTPPSQYSCYHFNLITSAFNEFNPSDQKPFTQQFGAGALVYFGNSLFLAGGLASNDRALLASQVSSLLNILELDKAKMTNVSGSPGKFLCSWGTEFNGGKPGPICAPVAAGKYRPFSQTKAAPCGVGTASSSIGCASSQCCVPCEFGNFRNESHSATVCQACDVGNGEICPVGAYEVLTSADQEAYPFLAIDKTTESHPASLVSPSVPILPIVVIVIFITVFLLILAAIMYRDKKKSQDFVSFFLTDAQVERLAALYEKHALSRYGLSEREFFTMLSDDVENAKEFFPTLEEDEFDLLDAHELFVASDSFNSRNMNLDRFIRMAITCITSGWLAPHAGTKSESAEEFPDSEEALFSLERLDSYDLQHKRSLVGEAQIVHRTSYGGALRILFFISALVIVVAITLDFVTTGLIETKSLVPRSVIQSEFNTDTITTHANFVLGVDIAGVVRSMPSIRIYRDGCVSNDNGGCNSEVTVTPTNITINGNSSTQCFFSNVTEICTIEWKCLDCAIQETTTDAEVLFTVNPAMSAHYIATRMSSTTGIHQPTQSEFTGSLCLVCGEDQMSTVSNVIKPTSTDKIFTGFPPTKTTVELTPNFFVSDTLDRIMTPSIPRFTSSGYSLRPTGVYKGMEATASSFQRLFNVPVSFSLTSSYQTPVLTSRHLRGTFIELAAQLAGSVAGLGGASVILVHVLDYLSENRNFVKPEKKAPPKPKNKMDTAATVAKAAGMFKKGLFGGAAGGGFGKKKFGVGAAGGENNNKGNGNEQQIATGKVVHLIHDSKNPLSDEAAAEDSLATSAANNNEDEKQERGNSVVVHDGSEERENNNNNKEKKKEDDSTSESEEEEEETKRRSSSSAFRRKSVQQNAIQKQQNKQQQQQDEESLPTSPKEVPHNSVVEINIDLDEEELKESVKKQEEEEEEIASSPLGKAAQQAHAARLVKASRRPHYLNTQQLSSSVTSSSTSPKNLSLSSPSSSSAAAAAAAGGGGKSSLLSKLGNNKSNSNNQSDTKQQQSPEAASSSSPLSLKNDAGALLESGFSLKQAHAILELLNKKK